MQTDVTPDGVSVVIIVALAIKIALLSELTRWHSRPSCSSGAKCVVRPIKRHQTDSSCIVCGDWSIFPPAFLSRLSRFFTSTSLIDRPKFVPHGMRSGNGVR